MEELLQRAKDPRIQFVTFSGFVRKNCVGEVRNFALGFVSTDWIAFLDDDDTLSSQYVHFLEMEIEINPAVDLVSFRMFDSRVKDKHNKLKIFPEENSAVARRGHIGISFAFEAAG